MSCTPSLPMSPAPKWYHIVQRLMDAVGAIGNHRRRADPVVVIEAGRRIDVLPGGRASCGVECSSTWRPARRRSLRRASTFTASIIIGVLRLCVPCCTMYVVPLRRLDEQPAFANVVRDRLLDVDVLARRRTPGSRRANANGRAWRRSRRRPICRRESAAGRRRPCSFRRRASPAVAASRS